VIASGKGRAIAITGDRLASLPDVATMQEQGAKGGFYDTRAFAVFAVPSATPKDIVKTLADALFEAGGDPKVKQLMANYLIKGPLNFEQTNAVFKRDTEVMLAVLKEIGLKPE
jgi:tripartite-type tricarboxylate transporter receptor subunit TctC